uniref:Uncharacterized protein n=1 Tax=Rhizophora mucronata TaxID=61149 RepID=A0A2P2P5P3_RHIMU
MWSQLWVSFFFAILLLLCHPLLSQCGGNFCVNGDNDIQFTYASA